MIYQNYEGVLPDAQHYSCLFNDIALFREVVQHKLWTVAEYNEAWLAAKRLGYITGDLNNDGDFDDPGEDEIKNFNGLFDLLQLPLRVFDIEHSEFLLMKDSNGRVRLAPQLMPENYWTIERWVWQIGHFVKGDGTGLKQPTWDSIRGGSQTRKNGRLESLRAFEIVL